MQLGFTGQKTLEAAKRDLQRYHKKGKEGVVIETPWGFVHVIGRVVYDSKEYTEECATQEVE